MALGDGIRRNIKDVEPTERAMLRDAIVEMHHRYYPGNTGDTPPGHVSWWFKQDEIHQSTHVHNGPEFLPWHRELINRFEDLLREINPQLTLHYWDFRDDPRNIPDGNVGGGVRGLVRLFDDIANPFMGSSSDSAGDPWLQEKFYDPAAGTPGHPPARIEGDDLDHNPYDPPTDIPRTRAPFVIGSAPAPMTNVANSEINDHGTGILQQTNFSSMRQALEQLHNEAHIYFANISPHLAFRDPFVYLLHSNVDRIYSKWQTDPAYPARLQPTTVYGNESTGDFLVNDEEHAVPQIQNLTHNVEPWSTGANTFRDVDPANPANIINVTFNIRPWSAPDNQGQPHDYHDISVVTPPHYDTNHITVGVARTENLDNLINFNKETSPVSEIKIAVINKSSTVKDVDISRVVSALQKQVNRDFVPAWGIGCDLTIYPRNSTPPPTAWQLIILDDSDQADNLGYHQVTASGLPLGKVFARTAQASWTVTASHELLEMLADPGINRYALSFEPVNNDLNWVLFYAYEVCDPCHLDSDGYMIDGVQVSDFVFPAWFQSGLPVGTRYDFQNKITQAFQLLPQGVIQVFDVTSGYGFRNQFASPPMHGRVPSQAQERILV